MITRRRLLTNIGLATAAGLTGLPRALASWGPEAGDGGVTYGEIRQFGYRMSSQEWERCQGQLRSFLSDPYTSLFALFGTTYGGDGRTTFGLPDLEGYLEMPWYVGLGGRWPSLRSDPNPPAILGQVQPFVYPDRKLPVGWTECAGQLLQIREKPENQRLFELIGDRFGGDGRDTFALPDLRAETRVTWGIAVTGIDPERLDFESAQPARIVGQMTPFAYSFAPPGWERCTGERLERERSPMLHTLLQDPWFLREPPPEEELRAAEVSLPTVPFHRSLTWSIALTGDAPRLY